MRQGTSAHGLRSALSTGCLTPRGSLCQRDADAAAHCEEMVKPGARASRAKVACPDRVHLGESYAPRAAERFTLRSLGGLPIDPVAEPGTVTRRQLQSRQTRRELRRVQASSGLETFAMATGTVKWFNGEKGFGFIYAKAPTTSSCITPPSRGRASAPSRRARRWSSTRPLAGRAKKPRTSA